MGTGGGGGEGRGAGEAGSQWPSSVAPAEVMVIEARSSVLREWPEQASGLVLVGQGQNEILGILEAETDWRLAQPWSSSLDREQILFLCSFESRNDSRVKERWDDVWC